MDFPFFPFYVRDWLGDPKVRSLTHEERGVYIDLMNFMWQNGGGQCSLPDDDKRIARMLGVSVLKWRNWRKVLVDGPEAVIHLDNGRIFCPRLTREFEKVTSVSQKRSGAANTRWHGGSEAKTASQSQSVDASASVLHMQSDMQNDAIPDTDTEVCVLTPLAPLDETLQNFDELEVQFGLRYGADGWQTLRSYWQDRHEQLTDGAFAKSEISDWLLRAKPYKADTVLAAIAAQMQDAPGTGPSYALGIMRNIERGLSGGDQPTRGNGGSDRRGAGRRGADLGVYSQENLADLVIGGGAEPAD